MITFYLDTETTGFNPVTNDIIQLAGILEGDGIYKEFNEFCRPFDLNNVSPDALKVNKLTLDQLKGFQSGPEMFKKLKDFLSGVKVTATEKIILVGQNISFDRNFLRQFFIKNGASSGAFDAIFGYHSVDLISISYFLKSRGLISPPNFKLASLATYFNMETEGLHDAYNDVKTTYNIIKEMQEKYLIKLEDSLKK